MKVWITVPMTLYIEGEDEIAEYVAEHPEVKNSTLYRGE